MSTEAMRHIAENVYPYWQLLLFFIFIGIAAWAYWPTKKRREAMKDHAEIPLRDDNGRA